MSEHFDEFFDDAEKIATSQLKEVKRHLREILDNDGNARPGVTAEQVQAATAIIKRIKRSYNKINNSAQELVDEYQALGVHKANLRNKYEKQGIDHIIRRMPMVRSLLGY